MKAYELTYIVSSAIVSAEAEDVQKEVEGFIQAKGGVILKSEKSVPQSLAYPIKRQSSGYFMTAEFQLEEKEVHGLKALLEKDSKVLRHTLLIKKPAKQMKERRTRKPAAAATSKEKASSNEVFKEKVKKEAKPVESEDIDKKLEEMLSE